MLQFVRLLSTACLFTLAVGPLGCDSDDNGPAEGEGEGGGGVVEPGGEGEGDEGGGGGEGGGEQGEGEGEVPGGEGEGEVPGGEGEAPPCPGDDICCDDVPCADADLVCIAGACVPPPCEDNAECCENAPCRGNDQCINGSCIPCGCADDASCGPDRICDECTCIPSCTVDQDCVAGERCTVETGRCVVRDWCERNIECPGDKACVDRECVDPVAHDDCPGAIALNSGDTEVGSTRRAVDRYSGSCSERPSPEVIYTFEVPEDSGLRILVDGTTDRLDPTVFLRTNCGPDADAQEIACTDVPFSFTEQLEVAQVPANTYFLFIESFRDDVQGDFEVTLEVVPGQICVGDQAEPNDTRDRPSDLFLADDEDLHLCPDDTDWFSVNLQVGDQVLIRADSPEGFGQLELSLETAGGEPVQGQTAREGGIVELDVQQIAAGGQHLLRVDHPDDDAQIAYSLDVEVFTLNGTCDCVNPTTLRPGAEHIAHSNTCECGHITAGSCRSGIRHTASERPYKFRLDDWASVDIQVEADWDYIVYMRQACIGDDPENELSCEAADDIHHDALPPGVYYVYVDGRRDECGDFDLSLEIGPPNFPPDNNVCGGAVELLVGQSVEGETTFASNNFRTERSNPPGGCETSPFGHQGRDVVYWFEIAQPALIRAELVTNGWEGVVYMRENCQEEGSQVACGLAEEEGDSSLAQNDLDPGRYFVFVDGYRTGRGPFSLTLTEVLDDDPPPGGDDG